MNDTALHHRLKAIYREKEQELLLAKLRADPGKVPSLSRDDMMRIMNNVVQKYLIHSEKGQGTKLFL